MTTTSHPLPAFHQDDLDAAIESLLDEARTHAAIRHPFLVRFASGDFRDNEAALRRYAIEYRAYAAWFPRYLKAVIDSLEREEHRTLLRHNLEEEQGLYGPEECDELRAVGIDPRTVQGVPHPQLFQQFCRALGIGDDELASPSRAAADWRLQFLNFLRTATPAQAVGALGLGTEYIVRPIYEQLLKGILQLGTLRRDEFVFFELHCLVDDQHQADLLEIARDLAREPGGLQGLRSGMRTALMLRCRFWDELYSRVLDHQLRENA